MGIDLRRAHRSRRGRQIQVCGQVVPHRIRESAYRLGACDPALRPDGADARDGPVLIGRLTMHVLSLFRAEEPEKAR
ncbi:hypothetical protein GCM10027061_14100 [Nesterenkonia suensis]